MASPKRILRRKMFANLYWRGRLSKFLAEIASASVDRLVRARFFSFILTVRRFWHTAIHLGFVFKSAAHYKNIVCMLKCSLIINGKWLCGKTRINNNQRFLIITSNSPKKIKLILLVAAICKCSNIEPTDNKVRIG